jgi:hypothetical protein
MSIRRTISCHVLRLLVLLPVGLDLMAQGVPDKFTNLQTLPKNISREDLVQDMRGFAFALDANCDTCHVHKDAAHPDVMDFASDEKAAKRTARTMIRMTEDINRNYIDAGTTKPVTRVECFTCHRGAVNPRTLQAVLSEALAKDGTDSAVSLYRKLRKENYGNGQYDFSEKSLNLLSESLLRQKKAKEAAAMMELNAEVNAPLSKWGYGCLALSHRANQETQKAELDFEKILELDPDNSWASDELKSIRSARQAH